MQNQSHAMLKRNFKWKKLSHGTRVALSYSAFLLLCIILMVMLYSFASSTARANFWEQYMVQHKSHVQTMDDYLTTIESYARQLLNDSTFVRMTNMEDPRAGATVLAADQVMKKLADRSYIMVNFPVLESHIYLPRLNYVISSIQYTEARQYFTAFRKFVPDKCDQFIDLLMNAGSRGRNMDVSAYTGIDNERFYILDVNGFLNRNVPAVIWFEWDNRLLQRLFLGDDQPQAVMTAYNAQGETELLLWAAEGDAAMAEAARSVSVDADGQGQLGSMHVLSAQSGRNGWTYRLLLPESLCRQATGNYNWIFGLLLILSTLAGGAMVVAMVRRNLRPIEQLSDQLVEVQRDNAVLAGDLEKQKPLVMASYVRKLLSGHISSQEEFAYILQEMGLEAGKVQFRVVYLTALDQLNTDAGPNPNRNELIAQALPKYFSGRLPFYYYTTLTNEYVILCAFEPDTADTLMEVQARVIAMHEAFATEHSLWLSAGVGCACTQPMNLWESYEQARMAVRYTTRNHVFLPYEMMQKEPGSVYYPIELSAKLLHFITTGNREQVSELFALIHRENIEERTLPENLLTFLLSDIRNTLLKARFSVKKVTEEQQHQLEQLDRQLEGLPGFALSEHIGLALCEYFQEVNAPGDPIPDVQRYLRDHFTDPAMCLSLLSAQFHISESYLSHQFKEKTGQNFSVYLEDLRLNEAARQLKSNKDCSLQNLYLELGYNSAVSFRRAFKKKFGMTPSAMREQ